jgi:hypothetical protein
MSKTDFQALKERLLRAGIAPRHVRRYIAELRNHFDDVVREQTARGRTSAEAAAVARERIGSDESLAAAVLDQPSLRSITARFPWAVFGVGPIASLFLVLIAAAFLETGLLRLVFVMSGDQYGGSATPHWLRQFIWAMNHLIMYVAPLALAAVIFSVGIRQRMSFSWIVVGVVLVAVAGGFHVLGIPEAGRPPNAGFGLAPTPVFVANPADAPRCCLPIVGQFQWIPETAVWRAAINLSLIAAAYLLFLRKRFAATVA